MRTLLYLIVCCFIFSCQPKTTTSVESDATETPTPNNLIGTAWKLTGMTFYEKDEYIMPPATDKRGLHLQFVDDTTISARLTVNNCNATYALNGENMSVTLGGCTKRCCDTKFGKDFWAVLGSAKSYKLNGKYLDIRGTEKILKLEKMEMLDK